MDPQAALFDRIREKCRRQQWYGAEMDDPAWFGNRYDPAMDHDGRLRVRLNDPQKFGFRYAPATEEQLLATEEALGFPLPPLLRALYANIANGGFGPGHGIRGAIGGFDGGETGTILKYLSSIDTEYVYPWCSERRVINFADDDDQWEELTGEGRNGVVRTVRYLKLSSCFWPEQFLQICDWDCVNESCLDCKTGCVYLFGMAEDESHLIQLQASSLEEWLEHCTELPFDSADLFECLPRSSV